MSSAFLSSIPTSQLDPTVVHLLSKFSTISKKTKRNSRKWNSQAKRKGVAAVEFATVAPLLILMIFLMVESSRYLMALHATTGAARAAARATAISGASSTEAATIAKNYMSSSSFASDTVTLDIDDSPSTIENMNQISCTVTIDFDAVSVIGNPFSIGANSVVGFSSMLAPTTN